MPELAYYCRCVWCPPADRCGPVWRRSIVEESAELKGKRDLAREEWFLSALGLAPPPIEEMLAAIGEVGRGGDRERAEGWAELMQETLASRKDVEGSVRLLALRCRLGTDDERSREACRAALKGLYAGEKRGLIIGAAGFDDALPAAECIRRLSALTRFKPGVLCQERTWGFGVVQRVDDFYGKVVIDFTDKPGHQMSFAYAAEALELVGENHLLAVKHKRPEEVLRLVQEAPWQVVKMALESFGEMTATDLRERLVERVVPESDWKRFWEVARRELSADAGVEVPARRSEPLRLVGGEEEVRQQGLAALEDERDPALILQRVQDLERRGSLSNMGEEERALVIGKLKFAIHGAEGSHPDLAGRGLVALARAGRGADAEQVVKLTRPFFEGGSFLEATESMGVRDIEGLVEHLWHQDGPRLECMLLDAFPSLTFSALNVAIRFLTRRGRKEACTSRLRELVAAGEPEVAVVYWLCRNYALARDGGIAEAPELLRRAVELLETGSSGWRLKVRNQLCALFEQDRWIAEVVGDLDARGRGVFLKRVQNAKGWDIADRRSVMAKIVKMYPDLAVVLAAGDAETASKAGTARFTSWRSYREKQRQLRELLERAIPANSREIATARSYGDLRENFEYQSARDRQRLLLQRKEEIGKDLEAVKGTDFKGFPSDRAGMGTGVVLRMDGGRELRFYLLGEWDSDEDLGIVSCTSGVAGALAGHRAGDQVDLTGERGTIAEVTSLPDSIAAWAAGGGEGENRG